MRTCRKCRSYRVCSGHFYIVESEIGKVYIAWYNYTEIRWCPYQVEWIILNSETLLDGRWPPDPRGSGYTDSMIKTGFKNEAYFTKPVEILAEVNRRLDRTGEDGKKLRDEILADAELSEESELALKYVQGWRYNRLSYSDWKKQGKYRVI